MSRPRKHRSNLPPCVYQKHGGFWYVKRGQWKKIGDTFPQAMAAYGLIDAAPTPGTMPQVIEDAFAAMKARKNPLAAATIEQYGVAARKLKLLLAEFNPEQVKSRHVAGIKVSMAGTPNMGNRCISFLKQVFVYAVEMQLCDSNPCIGISRHEEHERDRYISHEELTAIYAQSGDRLRAIIELLYYSAQRVDDVLKLGRAAVSDKGIDFRQKKTKTRLTVKASAGLDQGVQLAKTLGPQGNIASFALLPGRTGKAADYRTVARQWVNACKAAGVEDAQLRDIRAKAITDADGEGLDPTALAGHASPAMTRRYLRNRKAKVVTGPSIRQALDN